MQRLRAFEYHEPSSIEETVEILESTDRSAQLLAGGTDLVVDMKSGRLRPSTVVNLKRVPHLSEIVVKDAVTHIGALTRVTAIEASAEVWHRHPGLAQAASVLASPPVRALATIGGNVGRASPASDLGPALIAHDARATVVGSSGSRDVAVEDLYVSPGVTSLGASDVITEFRIPRAPLGFGSAHVKLGKRGSGTDIALAGVSASIVTGQDGAVADCRIALASLGPTPFRAAEAESILCAQRPSDETIADAAGAASSAAQPIDDLRASASYRLRLARVLTLRSLNEALDVATARAVAR